MHEGSKNYLIYNKEYPLIYNKEYPGSILQKKKKKRAVLQEE